MAEVKKRVDVWRTGGGIDHNFCNLLEENYSVAYTKPPQIILLFRRNTPRFQTIVRLRKKYGFDVLLISNTSENVPLAIDNVDYSFSFMPTNGSNFRLPFIMPLPVINPEEPNYVTHDEIPKEMVSNFRKQGKDKFCNFVYSNNTLTSQTLIRMEFCKLLSQYKMVDCPGRSMNNMTENNLIGTGWHEKIEFLSRYKFTIAFENSSSDHYVTEKIVHPLLVGSIPIYWGCPQITEYYNPESFINCHDYDSFEDVVERVKEIDKNPELHKQYLDAPHVLPDSRLHSVTREGASAHISRIVEEGLERTERRPFDSQPVLIKKMRFYAWLLKNSHRYILTLMQLVRRKLGIKSHHFIYRVSPNFWRRGFFKTN